MHQHQINYSHPTSSLPVQRHGKRICSDPSPDDRRTSQAQGYNRSHQTPSGERHEHRDAYLDMQCAEHSMPSHNLFSNLRNEFEKPIPLRCSTDVEPLTPMGATKDISSERNMRVFKANCAECIAPKSSTLRCYRRHLDLQSNQQSNPFQGWTSGEPREPREPLFNTVKPTYISPNGNHKRM